MTAPAAAAKMTMTLSGLRQSSELRLRLYHVVGLFLLWCAPQTAASTPLHTAPPDAPAPPTPRRMTLNIGLNLGVNFVMKARPRGLGFNFPLAFTMCHMYFSMAGCSLVMALVPSMRR